MYTQEQSTITLPNYIDIYIYVYLGGGSGQVENSLFMDHAEARV